MGGGNLIHLNLFWVLLLQPALPIQSPLNSLISPIADQVFCCPYCNYADQSAEAVRAHTISQHAVQPKFHCPLCQEQLVGRANLHFHLSHVHNVVPECVEKLLLVVRARATGRNGTGGEGTWSYRMGRVRQTD